MCAASFSQQLLSTCYHYDLMDGVAMGYGITLGVSLSIQSVILLADPLKVTNPSASDIISNVPLHLGVLSETELSDSENENNAVINKPEAESQLM
jgi:hypothetical protein